MIRQLIEKGADYVSIPDSIPPVVVVDAAWFRRLIIELEELREDKLDGELVALAEERRAEVLADPSRLITIEELMRLVAEDEEQRRREGRPPPDELR